MELVWGLGPFVALLLALAILPLIPATEHWWHSNQNKLIVSLGLAAITIAYYQFGHGYLNKPPGTASVQYMLKHALIDEYIPFLALLASLYIIAGGILLRGDIPATPLANVTVLAIGTGAASLIGTTGASMVLIRLLMRINMERRYKLHTFIFFIFLVSNIGGTLLPIGDPPLFVGYLRGVPFFWTLNLFWPWMVTVALLLLIYYIWDVRAYAAETMSAIRRDDAAIEPIHMRGIVNSFFMIGVVLTVAFVTPGRPFPGTAWVVPQFFREGVFFGLTLLSLWLTPVGVRGQNHFTYGPILEVAALFLGIFITMQPALEMLHGVGPWLSARNLVEPWQFFWGTGLLSSFLDNVPAYIVFFETARGLPTAPDSSAVNLLNNGEIDQHRLVAISLGAVFMGAMTYIGNGPNFMVRTICATAHGDLAVKMPSFVGYMAYSTVILLPIFVLITWLFLL